MLQRTNTTPHAPQLTPPIISSVNIAQPFTLASSPLPLPLPPSRLRDRIHLGLDRIHLGLLTFSKSAVGA